MSDTDEETVTITFECSEEDAEFLRDQKGQGYGFCLAQSEAASKALAARKSKYEKWKKEIASCTAPGQTLFESMLNANHSINLARLTEAAPQLLQMVIDGWASSYAKYGNGPLWDDTLLARAAAVIRATVPEEVADELLGTASSHTPKLPECPYPNCKQEAAYANGKAKAITCKQHAFHPATSLNLTSRHLLENL